MQFVTIRDKEHEMSYLFSGKKKKKISDNFTKTAKH